MPEPDPDLIDFDELWNVAPETMLYELYEPRNLDGTRVIQLDLSNGRELTLTMPAAKELARDLRAWLKAEAEESDP